jgi:hypothetical protein
VEAGELPREVETQPGPGYVAGLRCHDPAEAGEELVEAVGRNPHPGVGDADPPDVVAGRYGQGDGTAAGRVLYRVGQQVSDDGRDPFDVDRHRDLDVGALEEQGMGRAGEGLRHLDRRAGDLAQVGVPGGELEPALLEAGGLDHLLDQGVHLVGLGGEHGESLAGAFRDVAERPPLEHRQVATDHRDRTAQLMRGEVQELGLGPLQRSDALGQDGPVETGGDIGRVAGQVADLLGAEEGREGSGDYGQDTGAAVEREWDDDRGLRLGAGNGAHPLLFGCSELRLQTFGLCLVHPSGGED